MTKEKLPSPGKTVFYLIVSILLNSIGNGLTISLNLGSALWTAASVNLSHLIHLDLRVLMIIFGSLVIIINIIILKKIDIKRIIFNYIFMIPFSYLVGTTAIMFNNLHLEQLNIVVRILLDFLGIVMVAVGISIYQRVNLILHPMDDFLQIIRFKYFKGNSTIANWIAFLIPIFITLICFIISHKIYAINIGTIFSLLFQGSIIGYADKVVFPELKHLRMETNYRKS